jgi:hypothetical protein
MMHTLRERSAKWNERKGNGTAMSFGDRLGSVGSRYQHPGWFAFPSSRSNDCFEHYPQSGYLRSHHESGPLSRHVGCEVLMKLSRIEVGETICGVLYCTRLAEVAWEALAVVRLVLSSVWHVGRDIHQTSDGQARTGFGDYGSPIATTDKNAWSILLSKDALVAATSSNEAPRTTR